MNSRPCPASYADSYCFNGGECFAYYADGPGDVRFLPYCSCAPDYHGRRCEYLFNSELYGFNVVNKKESVPLVLAVSTLAAIVVCVLIFCCCCLYLYWRFGRDRGNDYSRDDSAEKTHYLEYHLMV